MAFIYWRQWQHEICVRDFIQNNYKPYEDDYSFLKGPNPKTNELWGDLKLLLEKERKAGGVLDADTRVISRADSHGAGYINKELEQIVGVQTDKPWKRAMMPMEDTELCQNKALQCHGREMDPEVIEMFQKHRKTHNDGVFACYTSDIRKARSNGIITGLPDGYGSWSDNW